MRMAVQLILTLTAAVSSEQVIITLTHGYMLLSCPTQKVYHPQAACPSLDQQRNPHSYKTSCRISSSYTGVYCTGVRMSYMRTNLYITSYSSNSLCALNNSSYPFNDFHFVTHCQQEYMCDGLKVVLVMATLLH